MKLILGLLAILSVGAVLDDKQEMDYGRTCLALAEFSEARSDGAAGMEAVAAVVMNRLADPAYPKSICEVVTQPGQFLGVESWPYPRRPWVTDARSWEMALAIADDAIAERMTVAPACAGATSFNQGGTAVPALTPVCKVGVHTFYVGVDRYVAKQE